MVTTGEAENYLVKSEPQMVTLLRGLHHFPDTGTLCVEMLSLNGQQKQPNILGSRQEQYQQSWAD